MCFVWWFCPLHDRWELDAEGLSWEEAIEHAKRIMDMTGQPALVVGEDE